MKFGFSLIELLITVFLLGIISAVALPVYTSYITHARRIEAEVALNKLAVAMEKYQIEHGQYAGMTLPTSVHTRFYRFSVDVTVNGYLLKATPQGVQASRDVSCGELILDGVGERKNSGAKSVADCW